MNYIFYDFETTGKNTAWDQIIQLGAILTNDNLEEIDRFESKCYLKPGLIPTATALLVNKITVENLKSSNLSHYQFINQILKKFKSWGPAIYIGYNSINFDEEFLRKSFFKTLHDPYLTTNYGNKRADFLGIIRTAHIYKPDIVDFPIGNKGEPIFKLEKIAPLNGISNFKAHDALGDTSATLELAKIIKKSDKNFWFESLRTTNKDDANLIIEKEKLFCITESFFGKIKPYVVSFICYHPKYNWAQCFDLKNHPANYYELSIDLLKHAMSTSPKIIRDIRSNKHPVILNKEYISKLKDYSHLGLSELENRAKILEKNDQFKQKVKIISEEKAMEKEENISQLDIAYEEKIYHGFPSIGEKKIMDEFHVADWNTKFKIANKFKEEKYYYFAERLIYEESPQSLPDELYKKINRKIAQQVLSVNDEKWNTIPKTYKEIDDLRAKYEDQKNEINLKILNNLNKYIEDIEKKFQEA